eukprot:3063146-Alexandrium_andersonii.AAC.1
MQASEWDCAHRSNWGTPDLEVGERKRSVGKHEAGEEGSNCGAVADRNPPTERGDTTSQGP